MKKNIMVFTHTDLDGVVSPIILRECLEMLHPEINYTFKVHYCETGKNGTINTIIQEFLDSKKIVDEVYVLDLAPTEEVVQSLHDYSVENDVHFKIYDHHKTALYLNDLFEESCVKVTREYDGMKHSATSLIYSEVILENSSNSAELSKRLVQFGNLEYKMKNAFYLASIVRSWDTWDWNNDENDVWKEKAKNFNLLHGIEGTKTFVKRFNESCVPTFSETDLAIIEVLAKNEKEYIGSKVRNAQIGTMIFEEKELVYSFVNAEEHKSVLGNAMSEIEHEGKPVDFAVIFDNGYLSLRTKKEDIDVSAISVHFFNGGGHAKAAGGKIEFNAHNVIKEYFETLEKLTD